MAKKEIIKNMAILLVSIIIVLLVAEGILRLIVLPHYGIPPGTFVADEEVDYIPAANFEGVIYNKEHNMFALPLSLNEEGFRDQSWKKEKGEGVIRIITLGDSETFPDTVMIEEQYGKVMEPMLEEKWEKDIEIINMGVSGYGTQQSFKWFQRKGNEFNPDIVTYLFVANDLIENVEQRYTIISGSRVDRSWENKPVLGVIQMSIYQKSRLAREAYRMLKGTGKSVTKKSESKKLGKEKWEVMKSTLHEMQKYYEEKNIQFVVIINPLDTSEENREIIQRMENILDELNIAYVNPTNTYNKQGGKEKFRWEFDSHLNPKGHKLVAQEVANHLLQSRVHQ